MRCAMKIKALWYGGSSYSCPNPELDAKDIESYDSIKDALDMFWRRYNNMVSPATPCVDESTEMHLYLGNEYTPNGPDRIISIGPRGGIRVERV